MTALPGWPAVSGAATFQHIRRSLAGQIVKNTAGALRSGIFPFSTAPLVTGTASMNVAVGAFVAVADRNGAVFIPNDGSVNVLLSSAPGSGSRWSIVYVKQRESEPPFSDGATGPIIDKVESTTSESAARTLLPAGAVELAVVKVDAGSATTSAVGVTITQTAQFTAAAGGAVPFRTRAEMDATTSFMVGQTAVVFADANTAFRGEWVFDGTRWRPGAGVELQEAFTWLRANVDDTHQYPQLVDDAANTTDATIATFQRVSGTDPDGVGGLKIAVPGVYHISVNVVLAVGVTGLTFVQVGADSDIFWLRSNAVAGEGRMSVGQILRTTTADQVVPIVFYKKNGSLGLNTGRVIVRRLS